MDAVTQSGFKAQMIVSGAGDYKYLDILSVHGGKRKAMEYVRSIFGIRPERVVAAGDSGNDILMLEGVPATLLLSALKRLSCVRIVLTRLCCFQVKVLELLLVMHSHCY